MNRFIIKPSNMYTTEINSYGTFENEKRSVFGWTLRPLNPGYDSPSGGRVTLLNTDIEMGYQGYTRALLNQSNIECYQMEICAG